MAETPNRVALDRVDWLNVLPILRLGGALRQALQPGKLIVALIAIVLLHLTGLLMDCVWPEQEQTRPVDGQMIAVEVEYDSFTEQGIYGTILAQEHDAFRTLMSSALRLDHGFGPSGGVADALMSMVVWTPAQAINEHPCFTVIYGLIALVILLPASGIICRMSAVQVCLGKSSPMMRSTRFVKKRWAWYLLGPLLPLLFLLLIACVLMLAGLVFFNVAWLEVLGALLYGLMLLGGLVIAVVGLALVLSLFMMPAAMSVEGSDGFDVIARTFNYVLFKPWQFATYLLGAMVYLAAVYVIVAALAGVTVNATHYFVDVGSFTDATSTHQGESSVTPRFNAVMHGGDSQDHASIITASWIVDRWFELVSALVAAVVFSTLCCLQTQVYVLMRRCADGAPLDMCAPEEEKDLWSSPADMVDPVAQKIAEQGPIGQPQPAEPEAQAPAEAPGAADEADDASADKPADGPTEG